MLGSGSAKSRVVAHGIPPDGYFRAPNARIETSRKLCVLNASCVDTEICIAILKARDLPNRQRSANDAETRPAVQMTQFDTTVPIVRFISSRKFPACG